MTFSLRLVRVAILAAGAALSSACSLFGPSTPAMKLYVFHCGDIVTKDVSIFSPGVNLGQRKQLTNSCYLIQHPKGNLIWDTGLNDAIGTQGVDAFDGKFHLSVSKPLAPQLAEIGIKPDDIQYLGISHFHADHTGNANLFSNATLLIQQEEFDAAFGPEPQKYGFAPETYSTFGRKNARVLQGDLDLFGDGRVVIKKAVGHTPGHQMLFLDMPKSGPIVLSGDLYHFTSNRQHRRVPSFNFSKEKTLESMEAMEQFTAAKHAQFWIQHDLEQNQDIRHSPEFYK